AVPAGEAGPASLAPAPVVPAPPAEPQPEPEAVHGSGADGTDEAESTGEHPHFGDSGLPQRRRGRTLAAAHPEGPDAAGAETRRTAAPTGASRSAARFGSFRQAVRAAGTPGGAAAIPGGGAGPGEEQQPAQTTDLEGNTRS
ncbi:hypothetical protein J7E97_35280, partial [Streptomyces sp. ISL-66]|nr:hypothetical protein [Streptomyces sp. ISL-66]